MRVDEAGDDQLVGGVDSFVNAPIAKFGQLFVAFDRLGETGADRRDYTIDDQDVAHQRLVDVAVVIVNPAILDNCDALCNFGRWHRPSGLKSDEAF